MIECNTKHPARADPKRTIRAFFVSVFKNNTASPMNDSKKKNSSSPYTEVNLMLNNANTIRAVSNVNRVTKRIFRVFMIKSLKRKMPY
jgi:UDP-glucose 4-epimerase